MTADKEANTIRPCNRFKLTFTAPETERLQRFHERLLHTGAVFLPIGATVLQLILKIRFKAGYSATKNRQFYFTYGFYRCHCGKEIWLRPSTAKQRKSCGCMFGGKTHGLSRKHPLYETWMGIKQRCYNHSSERFHRYGGRGIKVCNQWRFSFITFYIWGIENGWKLGLTLERKDNDKGYNPENCCFIPRSRQARNRVTNKLTMKQVQEIRVCYDSGLATNLELARRYNVAQTTMHRVVNRRIWKEDVS